MITMGNKLPSYVRIGGHTVRVRMVEGLRENEEAFGQWIENDLEILIDANLSRTLMWETFWHEIIESINALTDAQLNHNFIQTAGLLLHQIMQSMSESSRGDGHNAV